MARALIVFLSLIIFSCNDEGDKKSNEANNPELLLGVDDLALEIRNFDQQLCGIVRIDSNAATYHIYIDKNLCTEKIKMDGEIIMTLVRGNEWKEQNSAIDITYINFKIERADEVGDDDTKKFYGPRTINGTERVINLSGKTIEDFKAGRISLLRRKTVASNLTVKYDDKAGTTTLNKRSMRELIRDKAGNQMITTRGDTIINDYANVQEWGVDGNNNSFFTAIENPIIRSLCYNKMWILTEGKRVRYGLNYVRQNIFGVTEIGEIDGTCSPYGFKVIYENTNNHIGDTTIIYKY